MSFPLKYTDHTLSFFSSTWPKWEYSPLFFNFDFSKSNTIMVQLPWKPRQRPGPSFFHGTLPALSSFPVFNSKRIFFPPCSSGDLFSRKVSLLDFHDPSTSPPFHSAFPFASFPHRPLREIPFSFIDDRKDLDRSHPTSFS